METIILMMYMSFAGNGLTGEMYMEIKGFDTLEACEATLVTYEQNTAGNVVEFEAECTIEAEA